MNLGLASIGLPKVKLLFNWVGIMVGMGHFLVPFMVFPILSEFGGLLRA